MSDERPSCPICLQAPRGPVCARCGIDVATGELVQAPARLGRAVVEVSREDEGWSLRAVGRRLPEGAFGALVVAALIVLVQPLLLFGVARGVASLYLLAFLLLSRARGVVRAARPFQLEEIGGELLRAGPLAVALTPALAHPGAAVGVALLLPVLLGAAASERPLADLAPRALLTAVRRSEGLVRTSALAGLLLGPALAAFHVAGAVSLWWPPLAVAAATVVAVAAGLARRAAELRR